MEPDQIQRIIKTCFVKRIKANKDPGRLESILKSFQWVPVFSTIAHASRSLLRLRHRIYRRRLITSTLFTIFSSVKNVTLYGATDVLPSRSARITVQIACLRSQAQAFVQKRIGQAIRPVLDAKVLNRFEKMRSQLLLLSYLQQHSICCVLRSYRNVRWSNAYDIQCRWRTTFLLILQSL